MRELRVYITLLFCALLFANCTPRKVANQIQEKVAVEAVENITGSLSGGWVVTLRVRNDTGYQPTLQSAEADIFFSGTQTVHASLMAPITLPKHRISSIDIPLEISVQNPLKALSLLMQLSTQNYNGVEFSLTSTIELMGIKKDISIEKSSVQTILNQLGYTAQ